MTVMMAGMVGTWSDDTRTAYRTCPLCEAGCGLEITVRNDTVVRIRGDRDDVFSKGFICPKGSTLRQLHDDPDRVRTPLVKRNGRHVEVSWREAWDEIERRIAAFQSEFDRQQMAVYLGNPTAHNLSPMLYNRVLLQAMGTRARFSASTVDQMPRQVAAAYVFGTAVTVPVPDLDHTDCLVIIGANPYASNGSLCTAPDFPGRIEAIQARGGTVVVIDPRRTRTAEQADWWLPIRPGTDALLLAALVTALREAGAVDPGDHVGQWLAGLDEVLAALGVFTPESVATATGVPASDIRRLATLLSSAASASVYGRMGTTTAGMNGHGFGTVASWLVDVVNIVTGNLDRRGGAMFPTPVTGGPNTRGQARRGKGFRVGRGQTRVSELPEVMGEYPVAALAEEISTPGEGRLRGLVTIAGNPVLSTPHSDALDAALSTLELMISIDTALNETTRHADVILPPPSQLQRSHYDVLLLQFAVRNVANFSEAVLPLDEDQPDEWEIICRLARVFAGQPADGSLDDTDEAVAASLLRSATADPSSPVYGRNADELLASIDERGPERVLDIMLQVGPFGAGFGARPDGISLQQLREYPHGVDLGALQPRLPDVLRTPSGMIELAHPVLMADLHRLREAHDHAHARDTADAPLVLVGRRDLRSNNSWMHNVEVLVKGRPRCTLQVHPADAAARQLANGDPAVVTSRVGSVTATVEVTEQVTAGVVSLPHGWGHGVEGTRGRIAAEHAGVNANILTDPTAIDPLSGTAVLNGIPVEVAAVR
jgi:anaerobic selenocysteine-containing dehydrogenase